MRNLYDVEIYKEYYKNTTSQYSKFLEYYNKAFKTIKTEYAKENIDLNTYIKEKKYLDYENSIIVKNKDKILTKYHKLLIRAFSFIIVFFLIFRPILIPISEYVVSITGNPLVNSLNVIITLVVAFKLVFFIDKKFLKLVYDTKYKDINGKTIEMFEKVDKDGYDAEIMKELLKTDFINIRKDSERIYITNKQYRVEFEDTVKIVNIVELFELLVLHQLKADGVNVKEMVYFGKYGNMYINETRYGLKTLIYQMSKYIKEEGNVETLVDQYLSYLKGKGYLESFNKITLKDDTSEVEVFGEDFENDFVELIVENENMSVKSPLVKQIEDDVNNYIELVVNQYKTIGYQKEQLDDVHKDLEELEKRITDLNEVVYDTEYLTKFEELLQDIKDVKGLLKI